MKNSKIYAVKSGRKTGIYQNWDECKKQIDGFSGAVYKSFSNIEEAEEFLYGNKVGLDFKESNDTNTLYAYVDGSYSNEYKAYSFGCVIISQNQIIEKLSGSDQNSEYVEMRNVAGELLGAINAIKWAIKNGYSALKIFHDYEGIAKWANDEWSTNKVGTKEYVEFIKSSRKKINISFVKVKGHSGDTFNEMADLLAKKALDDYDKQMINEDKQLFFNCITQDLKTKAKVRVSFNFDNFIISEKQIEKFVLKYIEKEGISNEDINYITVQLNINSRLLTGTIIDKEKNERKFIISL